ncbi:MAG TPA: hypothetical protein PK926_06100 [Spirochaetota bacterium]|nr:hypothetical protein [Spirochaetota bacterium]HPI89060.1 hypothetical protein [Spirochaetota bacterium]HPR48729.1 hypothetical protein [Spirochaetota bacterium]
MKIKGETYSVEYQKDDNKIVFSGNLRLQSIESYDEIINFTMHHAMSTAEPLILDFTRLEIINSSGIASLGLFLVKLRDSEHNRKIVIYASKYIQWQAHSLNDLHELNANLEIVYIVHH